MLEASALVRAWSLRVRVVTDMAVCGRHSGLTPGSLIAGIPPTAALGGQCSQSQPAIWCGEKQSGYESELERNVLG